MDKIKERTFKIHTYIKNVNFILLKRKFLSYSIIILLFLLAIFFFVYLPYINKIADIDAMDSSLYQLEKNISTLHNLQEEMSRRKDTLSNILKGFENNSITYSKDNNVISFNPGYIRYTEFMRLLNLIENTGFIKILNLSISNLTGQERNIISPNKYIYLKKLIINYNSKVIK